MQKEKPKYFEPRKDEVGRFYTVSYNIPTVKKITEGLSEGQTIAVKMIPLSGDNEGVNFQTGYLDLKPYFKIEDLPEGVERDKPFKCWMTITKLDKENDVLEIAITENDSCNFTPKDDGYYLGRVNLVNRINPENQILKVELEKGVIVSVPVYCDNKDFTRINYDNLCCLKCKEDGSYVLVDVISEEGRIIQHPDKKTFKEHIRTAVMTFSEKPQKPQTNAQEQTQEKVKGQSGDDEITYVKLATENPYFVVPSDAFDFLIKKCGFADGSDTRKKILDKITSDYIRAAKNKDILVERVFDGVYHYSFETSYKIDGSAGKAPVFVNFKVDPEEGIYSIESVGLKSKNLRLILERDVYCEDWDKTMQDLAKEALPENWGKPSQKGNRTIHYPLLHSYFVMMYYVASIQGKIKKGEGNGMKMYAFNTGLMNRQYEYIYACFEPTDRRKAEQKRIRQGLRFIGFAEMGNGHPGKEMAELFAEPPEKIRCYKSAEDLVMDADYALNNYDLDINHILDRMYRLPKAFLERVCYGDLECKKYIMKGDYRRLKERMTKEVPDLQEQFKIQLDAAVKNGLKRVAWNYKTAIPIYFPAKNEMSLIIPLALTYDINRRPHVDAALAMSRSKISGRYQGATILTLDMAYTDSRQICKPDSDWLAPPDNISDNEDDD